MLGGEHHVRRTEQRVRTRGVHADHAAIGAKIDLGSFTAADPVALHLLDGRRPVQELEVLDEPVGIGGDAQQPLAEGDADDGMVAALGAALDDLLVGEDRAERLAPVHRNLSLERQPEGVLVAPNGAVALRAHVVRDR